MAAVPQRRTAYFTINPTLIDDLTPHYAGWYAGDDPWSSVYGGPLRLAVDARRFDVSPAWHAWVAAAPAVRLLAQVGTQSLHRHALGLANRFRAGIGLEPGDSAIVSLPTNGAAADAMAAARITASARAGRLRLSFHASTSDQDADFAADVLRRHVTSRHPATLRQPLLPPGPDRPDLYGFPVCSDLIARPRIVAGRRAIIWPTYHVVRFLPRGRPRHDGEDGLHTSACCTIPDVSRIARWSVPRARCIPGLRWS